MQDLGYTSFTITMHTNLWKEENAKKNGLGYGVLVQKTWYWYDSWIEHVKEWCEAHLSKVTVEPTRP